MTNSNNTQEATEKRIWIQWGEKKIVTRQMSTIDELVESGLIEKYASNFDYNHLIAREISRMKNGNCEYINFFIVEADAKFNYGLDFKIFQLYKVDGMQFMSEFRLGGSSLTSAPLKRVNLNIKTPVGYFDIFKMEVEEIKNMTETQKSHMKSMCAEFNENCKNKTIASFEYSTNAFYKKDMKYRNELREMVAKHNFIFA